MSDERLGLYALGLSLLTSAGTAFWGVWRWRAERGDKRVDRETSDRAAFIAERAAYHDEVKKDAERARQEAERIRLLLLAERERAEIWERRCRWMDDRAHELRHEVNNVRHIANGLAVLAKQPAPDWPANPPLPKLEDL